MRGALFTRAVFVDIPDLVLGCCPFGNDTLLDPHITLHATQDCWEVFAADLQMDCLEIRRLAAASVTAAAAPKARSWSGAKACWMGHAGFLLWSLVGGMSDLGPSWGFQSI